MHEINKLGLLKTDIITCTGKTLGENIAHSVNKNPEVIRPVENPYSKTGGIAVLRGNLAPDSCVGEALRRRPRDAVPFRPGPRV